MVANVLFYPLNQRKLHWMNNFHDFYFKCPGDPEPVQAAVDLIQSQLGKLPIFGICLGHQLIAHALGANV